MPDDIVAEATGPGGATVTYPAATAQDIVDGDIAPVCAPPAGSGFPLGTTTVTCTAQDSSHNTATGSFTVSVVDTTPPSINGMPDDISLEATGPGGATATFTAPTATDLVDGSVDVHCSPASGGSFPVGTTTVTCSATDAAGNTANRSLQVAVRDTTGPTLNLPADQVLVATSPAGAVAAFTATATDLVDGTIAVQCTPASASTFPIGSTTVSCVAADHAGNSAHGSFKVTVQRSIHGLHQPVDMTRVLNTVKAGSTAPLKFEVFAGTTEESSTSLIAAISLKKYNCDPLAALDPVDITTTGNTSLRYDTSAGQYVYNWQTSKSDKGCFQVAISTTDGATVIAQFKTA